MAKTKERIWLSEFKRRHRSGERDFTRERVLTFPVVVLWLLQKTTRSLQRHAHSFLRQLWPEEGAPSVTSSACTQARGKFRHTAFIELNQQVLLPEVYSAEQAKHVETWRGHRVLGMDTSNLRLPDREEITQQYGQSKAINGKGQLDQTYVSVRMSVLYDLLNDLGLDVTLGSQSIGERDLVLEHSAHIRSGDVVIWDRGFSGYTQMAWLQGQGADFVGRCSEHAFFAAKELFRLNRAGRSQIVKIRAHDQQKPNVRALHLPEEMVVRFMSVRLPTGELEVLVTSLLDEKQYPTEEFLDVYHWRWRHETYHQMLKGRLDLENWTGQTLESIRQDIYATVFLANVESLLRQEVDEELQQRGAELKNPIQVNRSVSYHALKEKLLDLFYKDAPIEETIAQIHTWMRCNPVSIRTRKSPRPKPSLHRSYNFQRSIRKVVF